MPTVNQHRNDLRSQLTLKTMIVRIGKFNTPIKVAIWDDVHPALRITERDVGKQVAVASENWSYSAYLKEHNGDHVLLKIMDRNANRGVNSRRTLYPQEIILHPDELTEERLEKHGEEVFDGRSVST